MSRVYISENAGTALIDELRARGHEICLMRPCSAVSEPISAHPDIFMCKIGTTPKSAVFRGNIEELGVKYPKDVPYNAVITSKYLICNEKYVSNTLKNLAISTFKGIKPVHVEQGYTKCNLVVIDDNHMICEDMGIFKALSENTDIDCLLVQGRQVKLDGYDYGFIGGCSGRIGDTIYFNGNLEDHPDYKSIKSFIEGAGYKIWFSKDYPLSDIGSIIEEDFDI